MFHWPCISAWSSQENTCSQCKARFSRVGKYDRLSGSLVGSVSVEQKDFSEDEDYYGEDAIDLCEKCRAPGNENEMLMCDGMAGTFSGVYHLGCVGLGSQG